MLAAELHQAVLTTAYIERTYGMGRPSMSFPPALSHRLVVHCKKAPYDVYIGRTIGDLRGQGWGNPFTVEKYGRDVAIEKYETWLRGPAGES